MAKKKLSAVPEEKSVGGVKKKTGVVAKKKTVAEPKKKSLAIPLTEAQIKRKQSVMLNSRSFRFLPVQAFRVVQAIKSTCLEDKFVPYDERATTYQLNAVFDAYVRGIYRGSNKKKYGGWLFKRSILQLFAGQRVKSLQPYQISVGFSFVAAFRHE